MIWPGTCSLMRAISISFRPGTAIGRAIRIYGIITVSVVIVNFIIFIKSVLWLLHSNHVNLAYQSKLEFSHQSVVHRIEDMKLARLDIKLALTS